MLVARVRALAAGPAVRLAVTVVVTTRLVLGVAVVLIDRAWPPTHTDGAHLEQLTSRDAPLWSLFGPWERWDALWYLHIARDGYAGGGGDSAFPPLFPTAMRALGPLVGGEVTLAALLLTTLSLVGGLTLLYRLLDADMDARTAQRTTLLLAVAPSALFLYAPYTESLFLLLSVGAFVLARRGALPAAGALAALATLCRVQGVTLVAPLAVEAYLVHRQARDGTGRSAVVRWAAVALPIGALAAWTLYTRLALGVSGGPLGAQQGWGRRFAWPWQSIGDGVRLVLAWSNPVELCNLVAVLGSLALLAVIIRRLPPSYAAYAAAMVAACLFTEVGQDPLLSTMRYLAVVFPLFAALATLRVRRPAVAVTMAGSAALTGLLLWNYVEFHFVG